MNIFIIPEGHPDYNSNIGSPCRLEDMFSDTDIANNEQVVIIKCYSDISDEEQHFYIDRAIVNIVSNVSKLSALEPIVTLNNDPSVNADITIHVSGGEGCSLVRK